MFRNIKLILETTSSNIIKLDSESININKEGVCEIRLKILFPGIAIITMTIEGTGIRIIKSLNISLPKTQIEPITSSIDSYTCVDAKTSIYLYSNKQYSTIYFTIKDPYALNDFLVYNGSIIIKKDMKLTAFTRNDDYLDSEPASFFFTVPHVIYFVSFDANGGSVDIVEKEVFFLRNWKFSKFIICSNSFDVIYFISFDAKEIRKNDEFGELPIPQKENFIFDGWYKEKSSIFVDVSQNITLYAKLIEIRNTSSENEIQTNNINQMQPIEKSNKNGKIIGIVVGCVALFVFVVILTIIIIIIKKEKSYKWYLRS